MARFGWTTANWLENATLSIAQNPCTIAAWARNSITGVLQALVSLGVNGTGGAMMLGVSTGNLLQAYDGNGVRVASSAVVYPPNQWFHGCAVFETPDTRSIYLDGNGVTATTSAFAFGPMNHVVVGAFHGVPNSTVSNEWSPAGTGELAEVAIWSVALTAGEAKKLALGLSPLAVRRESLVGYWPLANGGSASEPNMTNMGHPLTVIGALSQKTHSWGWKHNYAKGLILPHGR